MIIEILDGRVTVQRTPGNALVNALIDAAELAQKAERICPDGIALVHVHRALLEITSALCRLRQLVKQEEPQ